MEPDLIAERVARKSVGPLRRNKQLTERADTIGVGRPALPFICDLRV